MMNKYNFYDTADDSEYLTSEFSKLTVDEIDLTDLSSPHTWYPNARKKNRNVIIHAGPTNSGKTYTALKRLQSSSSGIYCGPLRLLAWEVAETLNKANVPCNLFTGVERKDVKDAKHKAVTVEIADVTCNYDCAIIDEIQLLASEERGHSFTRALLGLSANELHLCGDPSSIPLIKEILKVTSDTIEIKHYERLSPLVPLDFSVYSDIQAGDCIIAFSKTQLFETMRRIESLGNHRCCIVYGSLPPETRTKQATLFNDDQSGYDVLVATDAIGMGMNLNISRIIFSRLEKYDGTRMRSLSVSEIKQIAGRAGRYGSKYPVGKVTCQFSSDLPFLHSALKSPSPVLEKAGLFPSFSLLKMFSKKHPEKGIYEILSHFMEDAKLSKNYFLVNCKDLLKVAAVVDELPLNLEDKYLFCLSPIKMHEEIPAKALNKFAKYYSKKEICKPDELSLDNPFVPQTHYDLSILEASHKSLELYIWLSYHLEDNFPHRKEAVSMQSPISLLIEKYLEKYKDGRQIQFN